MLFHLEENPKSYKPFKVLNWQKIKNIKATTVNPQSLKSFEEFGWRMVRTCLEDDGIGLAAPQVGLYTRIILCQEFDIAETESGVKFKPTPIYKLYINPTFEAVIDKGKNEEKEFCLSVPGIGFSIKRFNEIMLSWDEPTKSGEFIRKTRLLRGWAARVLQHEIDHLNGISIPQRWKQQNQKPNSNKRNSRNRIRIRKKKK